MIKDTILKAVGKNKPSPMCSEDSKGYKPSVYITSEQLSDVTGWEIGKEYLLKVTMVGKNVSEKEGDKRTSADFEVIGAGEGDAEVSKESENAVEEKDAHEEMPEEDMGSGMKKVTEMRMKLKANPSKLFKKIVKDEYGK